MAVSNSGDKAISDVAVELGGATTYSFPTIMPHAEAQSKPLKDSIPPALKVSWKNADGVAVSKEVKIEKPLPDGFRGRVLFQIDGASDVKFFVVPDSDGGSHLIPWGYGDNWDGSILIPGMNQQ